MDDSVAAEEKTLQHIEGRAEAVRANTSPAGAEMVVEEAEELRLGWLRLRQGLCEAEDGLRSSLDSHSQYMARCQRLGEDINRLRLLMQGLDQELEGSRQAGDRADCTEEQILGQWKKYTVGCFIQGHVVKFYLLSYWRVTQVISLPCHSHKVVCQTKLDSLTECELLSDSSGVKLRVRGLNTASCRSHQSTSSVCILLAEQSLLHPAWRSDDPHIWYNFYAFMFLLMQPPPFIQALDN